MANEWGYKEHNGPSQWHKWYPVAEAGTRQSPVAIKTDNVTEAPDMPELKYKYDPNNCLSVTNTGASWRLDVNEEGSSLSGGPLGDEYKLLQIHAHWGGENWHDEKGSEHTIDGQAYEAELHLVHYNTKYGEAGKALDKPDGLAVLGVMIAVDDEKPHPEMAKLCDTLENIQLKGEKTSIQTPVDPIKLLPENKSYFTYPGSLTTPPLLESVTWILFKDPITTDCKQLCKMREMRIGDCPGTDTITNNYRPPCLLGNRTVKWVKA